MLTFAVDTSTRNGSLALLRDGVLLGSAIIPSEDGYSLGLTAIVEAVLQKSGVSLSQLDLFAVAAGPGSFTGLRVGLTAVKAWSEVFAKPIAAVSVLEAIAAQGRSSSPEAIIAPVMDARRGQIFGGVYRCNGGDPGRLHLIGEEVVMTAAEFLELIAGTTGAALPSFVSPTPEVFEPALAISKLAGASVEKVSPVLAPMIGLVGYRQGLRGETVDALGLDASYVRRTDAELKWKG